MIIFLLKSRRKEKYAERQEHTGKNGEPITLQQWIKEHSGKTLGPPSERGKLTSEEERMSKDIATSETDLNLHPSQ